MIVCFTWVFEVVCDAFLVHSDCCITTPSFICSRLAPAVGFFCSYFFYLSAGSVRSDRLILLERILILERPNTLCRMSSHEFSVSTLKLLTLVGLFYLAALC